MRKILVIFCLIFISLLSSCQKKDEVELKIPEYDFKISKLSEFYIFVYKTDCKYCKKDYFYLNDYYDTCHELDNYITIYSYNIDDYIKEDLLENLFGVDVDRVPTLIHVTAENQNEISAVGYLKVRNHILNLKNN